MRNFGKHFIGCLTGASIIAGFAAGHVTAQRSWDGTDALMQIPPPMFAENISLFRCDNQSAPSSYPASDRSTIETPLLSLIARCPDQHDIAIRIFSSGLQKQAKADLDGAIRDYLTAIGVEDKDRDVHWYLGSAYRAQGELYKAQEEFEKAVGMTPKKIGKVSQKIDTESHYSGPPVPSYSGGYGNGTGSGYGGADISPDRRIFKPARIAPAKGAPIHTYSGGYGSGYSHSDSETKSNVGDFWPPPKR